MISNRRTFSAADTERLIAAVDRAAGCWLTHVPHLIEALRSAIRRGLVVRPADVPADVITMNRRFAVENVNTGDWRYDAPGLPGARVSPAGMALLGARVGEEVYWMSAARPEVATVRRLSHQPENASRAVVRSPERVLRRAAVLSRN